MTTLPIFKPGDEIIDMWKGHVFNVVGFGNFKPNGLPTVQVYIYRDKAGYLSAMPEEDFIKRMMLCSSTSSDRNSGR